jgi:hypothetical protein
VRTSIAGDEDTGACGAAKDGVVDVGAAEVAAMAVVGMVVVVDASDMASDTRLLRLGVLRRE